MHETFIHSDNKVHIKTYMKIQFDFLLNSSEKHEISGLNKELRIFGTQWAIC